MSPSDFSCGGGSANEWVSGIAYFVAFRPGFEDAMELDVRGGSGGDSNHVADDFDGSDGCVGGNTRQIESNKAACDALPCGADGHVNGAAEIVGRKGVVKGGVCGGR